MAAKSHGRKRPQVKKTKSRTHIAAAPQKVADRKTRAAAPPVAGLPITVTDEEIMEKTADYDNVPRELRKVAMVGSLVMALLIALAIILS